MTDSVELARAKVNLSLHVTGRRADGYHLLDSLVVFPDLGDEVAVAPAARTTLTLTGPFAKGLLADADNLVLRAAALMPRVPAAIRLTKSLPLASGIGGGSADAAATLRALARTGDARLPDPASVLSLGADVPVCMTSRPARIQGVGEMVSHVSHLPPFWIVLVNPGVPCPTGAVFAAMGRRDNPGMGALPRQWRDLDDFVVWLAGQRNDLQAAAFELCPPARAASEALSAQHECRLARMSGSGATSIGIFPTEASARDASDQVRQAEPGWWVAAAPVLT